MKKKKKIRWDTLLLVIGIACLVMFAVISGVNAWQNQKSEETISAVRDLRAEEPVATDSSAEDTHDPAYDPLFETNSDMAGWLLVPDTGIDYPVMQTPEDEEYYLYRDFYGNEDKNGCLLLDTDSDLDAKGTNLIIHGHNMRSGAMFGELDEYAESDYGLAHGTFYFYTRTETREYELIAVFYSKVYDPDEEGFRYYQYFGADNEEEFNDFYDNIKELSLYDTGVTAEYGDEFLTLSTCAYHTTDGRFVVVARRVR